MDETEYLTEMLQLLVVRKMANYAASSSDGVFHHYGQKIFKRKPLKGKEYFLLFEHIVPGVAEIIVVMNMFKKIPTGTGGNFPKSIKFHCCWRKSTAGRYKWAGSPRKLLKDVKDRVDGIDIGMEVEKNIFEIM
ncbi:hypothetical protein GTA51_17040 [Desulfovibrio aerotolerans]|uniref:Uncharacterized protein n=1 Tax=Solidesulfovibrio aerotolerans TaxID=295255 RepID=A0A7C9IY92_9BACT|nr:hypothetical protein [Solidesulfovibrio aerotolerans]MYL84822.1 hypothetical protein [Solidesulfovibrio aerotolerans]